MITIPLRNSSEPARIDSEDYERVLGHTWYRHSAGYALTMIWVNGRQKGLYLHRLLLAAPPDLFVDHINHDRLDNRRENLRLATPAENSRHRRKSAKPAQSRFKGVTRTDSRVGWTAMISVNGRQIYLGRFRDEEEAARAYDAAALEHFGLFAALNFPGSATCRAA